MEKYYQSAERILERLVAFPVLGGDSNLSIAHYITDYLKENGVEVQEVPNAEGTKKGLYCRIGPAVDGGLVLSGHTDVVPVEGQPWNFPPFELSKPGDGKLYGRGTADMKGFLACCLACVPAMLREELKKPIYLAFSYDEEIGCLGAPELIRQLQSAYPEKPAYALIGEPTMLQPMSGQKAICDFITTVNGSQGHSSRMDSEVSALHQSTELIQWLIEQMKAQKFDTQPDQRFAPPYSTVHIGQIQAGTASNVVARECSFRWEVRTIPGTHPTEVVKVFEERCRAMEAELRPVFPEFTIRTEPAHAVVPGLDTPSDSKLLALLKKHTNAEEGAVAYASEAGQFDEAGLEAVICGPGSIEQAHRQDEYIAEAQLRAGVELILSLIGEFSRS